MSTASTNTPIAEGIGMTNDLHVTVQDKDTVGAIVPGMPMVAATPYLVTVAEMSCYEICSKLIPAGMITVGARVVIDHVGASKVGARLVAHAVLNSRDRNRFTFKIVIKDGDRTVANVEHVRAAVSLQKLMAAIG